MSREQRRDENGRGQNPTTTIYSKDALNKLAPKLNSNLNFKIYVALIYASLRTAEAYDPASLPVGRNRVAN
jgi:hypothetical protein